MKNLENNYGMNIRGKNNNISKFISRKFIITIASIILLTVVVFYKDLETAKWYAGALAALVGSFNIGQGIADKGAK